MKITFLGTAAAEGVPAVFCNCPACKRAKALGGREIRTRSQILIDDDTLFDFPMDTYMHMLAYKLDLSKVKRVLITHSHMDHCYPQEFCMRGAPFAHELAEQNVSVLCNAAVRDIFLEDTAREMRPEIGKSIELKVVCPFERLECGDTTVIALPAKHTAGEDCFVYYVERGGVGAIFLNDTGALDEDVYARAKLLGATVDFAAFDCTYGATGHGSGRHMGLYDIVGQVDIMNKVGLLRKNAKLYATHFSHNCELGYEGMVRAAAPFGIEIAYDGLTVEVG